VRELCQQFAGRSACTRAELPRPAMARCHASGTSLPGWLVLVPRRHTVALDDTTADEAADLGPLLRAVSSALRDVVRCRKTYVALFAEVEGFQHIHFHIIIPASPAWRRAIPPAIGHMGPAVPRSPVSTTRSAAGIIHQSDERYSAR
jgi:diadenosine tetraphosphate (Ap4A) HIT family hydrolase